jgi:hypothetical protein
MTKSGLFFITLLTLTLFSACTKDRTVSGFDAELFEKAQKKDGFVFYNLSTEYLESPKQAGHKSTYIRTKYNDIAAAMLDEKGLIISGVTFPDGSLIVNEMYTTKGEADKYAVMFKDPKNENADANGWVWSYFNADKTIIEPSSRKGTSCLACHSNGNNTLMSNYFLGAN